MQGKVCSFMGPHPETLAWNSQAWDPSWEVLQLSLREELLTLIEVCKVRHFISGMERGFDLWAAEILLELKAEYPITLECAISHEEQAARWEEVDRHRYFQLIERADYETMLQRRYTEGCIQKRNEYMVDQSDYLIAVQPPLCGGEKTLYYAKKRGVKLVLLPLDREAEPVLDENSVIVF